MPRKEILIKYQDIKINEIELSLRFLCTKVNYSGHDTINMLLHISYHHVWYNPSDRIVPGVIT